MNDWKPAPADFKPPADLVQPPPPPVNLGDVTVQDAPPAVEAPPDEKKEFKGLLVREGGDKVFLIKEGKKHWMTSPEAMAKLGFKFGDEVELDRITLGVIPEGSPIK